MEKIPKSPMESNINFQINESKKIEEEKTSSNTKESQSNNIINISQRNDSSYRIDNNNVSNTDSLYPLLFT
jgi:hypothetical protein